MPQDRDDLALTEAMPSPADREHGRFLPGVVLENRYRVVALAGRGGMGEVYRADDLKLGQAVALKFLPPDFERDPDRVQRLLGEVRIARQVAHPNVCRVYDVGEFEGRHFITMEYVDGEDLAALLRRIGRLSQEKAIELTRQVAAGLAAAHAQGIVHRDLKPANIMLDGRGQARITDFGLAAVADAVRGREAKAGTPAYMAPEQVAGGAITPRTDLYALGLVVYEMLTGRRAFGDATRSSHGPAAESSTSRPSSQVPGLDPAIDTAVLKCLENDPARRPASALELLASLPGGDPLEAALRAGETPSPEMVAAAGEEGTLTPVLAATLLGLAVLLTAATLFMAAKNFGLDQVEMPRSPDALREHARDVAQLLGDDIPARTTEWWFDMDPSYGQFSRATRGAPSLAQAQPAAFRFYYRQSPKPIFPVASPWGDPPTRRDPAPTWSGEAFVALDPRGNLLEFSRLARQVTPSDSGPAPRTDWTQLLSLTGVDIEHVRPAEPIWTPDVASDARAAWISRSGPAEVRLEAASWRGKPVWLRTIAPWERAERETPTSWSRASVMFVVLVGGLLVVFAALARHNLRLGRSDTRGALRVAVAVFLFFAIGNSLHYRWGWEPSRVWRWMQVQPYFPALSAWLYFMGVEPFFRRRWPHRLIAWTRLLEGRFSNPLVGREALIGMIAGTASVMVALIPAVIEGRPNRQLLLTMLPFGQSTDFWAATSEAISVGIMNGLGAFAMLLLMRIIFRRDSLAWIALGVLWSMLSPSVGSTSLLPWIALAIASTCYVLAVRVGLLAAVVASATANLLIGVAPLTLDFSRWYAWRTGVIAALLLALAVWGFRAVMGRRKFLSAAMFEG